MGSSSRLNWVNWPNTITLSRVGLGLLCLPLLVSTDRNALLLGFALMITAELTDLLDGVVARATKSITPAGKLLDPMADSMYRLTIFALFVQLAWMPAWMMCIFIIRDIGVAYLRMVAQQSGIPVASRFSGKAKAVAQGAAQLFVVGAVGLGLDNLLPWRFPALALAAAVTLYSLADYAFAMLNAPAQRTNAKA